MWFVLGFLAATWFWPAVIAVWILHEDKRLGTIQSTMTAEHLVRGGDGITG